MNLKEAEKLFLGGCSDDAYRYLGAHPAENGYVFRVYAPNAGSVRLVGDFNGWDTTVPPMERDGGFFTETVPAAKKFDCYKFYIEHPDGSFAEKADPFAFHTETRPGTASKLFESQFLWTDGKYLSAAAERNPLKRPVSIYEVHAGSWRRYPDGNCFSYRRLADELVPYVLEMGYTHIELMPVAEHPLDDSWGYQVTGYYAPTSRFGTPDDFRYFVNRCHEEGIGVILDWVGAHFPKDGCGLYEFDGTRLFEPKDSLRAEHPEWGTRNFDYGRNEVRSFLISNICFWLREYHIDGIRVDAVSSMIYLDYARKPGEWSPDRNGGNINSDAVSLLRDINSAAFRVNPGVIMAAEESTSFPMVTKPPYDGGLGFNFKWNMGWMHDTLDYFSADPLFRKGIHEKITFPLTYAFSENFILPLSHDEVVHGKKSLIARMPGDYADKFAGLRVLFAWMFVHPGKKLSFMGNEFAQFIEWDFSKELDWCLLAYDRHRQMREWVKALNRMYLTEPSFYENDSGWDGFRWLRADDRSTGVIAAERMSQTGRRIVCILNLCPVERKEWRIGIPEACTLGLLLSDAEKRFGGEGNLQKRIKTMPVPCDGFGNSALFDIPPMSAMFFRMLYIKG